MLGQQSVTILAQCRLIIVTIVLDIRRRQNPLQPNVVVSLLLLQPLLLRLSSGRYGGSLLLVLLLRSTHPTRQRSRLPAQLPAQCPCVRATANATTTAAAAAQRCVRRCGATAPVAMRAVQPVVVLLVVQLLLRLLKLPQLLLPPTAHAQQLAGVPAGHNGTAPREGAQHARMVRMEVRLVTMEVIVAPLILAVARRRRRRTGIVRRLVRPLVRHYGTN